MISAVKPKKYSVLHMVHNKHSIMPAIVIITFVIFLNEKKMIIQGEDH